MFVSLILDLHVPYSKQDVIIGIGAYIKQDEINGAMLHRGFNSPSPSPPPSYRIQDDRLQFRKDLFYFISGEKWQEVVVRGSIILMRRVLPSGLRKKCSAKFRRRNTGLKYILVQISPEFNHRKKEAKNNNDLQCRPS
jgi:hypothetical protein